MTQNGPQDGGWVLMTLDEKLARKSGVPARLPVPGGEVDGLAERGMNASAVRRWVEAFVAQVPPSWRKDNAELAASFDAFLAKGELWQRAQAAFAQRDFKRAAQTLKLVTNVDPSDHAAKANLAAAQASLGDHAAARATLESVRATFAGDAEFHLTLAQVLIALGERQGAAEELASALEADPANKAAMDALVQLGVLVAIYEDPRDAASLTYVRADGVARALAEAWDGAPRDAAYYLEQLAYHEAEGRADVALAAAERALGAGCGGALAERAEMGRAAALRGVGRRDDARAVANAWLAGHPQSAWARVELARCAIDEEAIDDAQAELDRALAIDPGDQAALLLRYWPRDPRDLNAIQAAIPALAAFAEAHAGAAGAWRSLARAKATVGADAEASTLLAKAVALAPTDDELRAELWGQLARERRHAQVLAEAAAIGELSKRHWTLRWSEAESYRAIGKLSEARAAFAAINLDDSLHVEVRRRAKKAVRGIEEKLGGAT
jgi:tetratricopeptide (TPR) repeat protein